MILAELEVFHSRPVAPTRRVALGSMNLPADPPPGFGGILLGGIVAANVVELDPDLLPDLANLMGQLENGQRISQPRLRYRLQRDKVGLQSTRHRLIGNGDALAFDLADGEPNQQILGAVYAAGELEPRARRGVMGTIRRGIAWQGPIGPDLITALAGFNGGQNWSMRAVSHPIEWALQMLGFTAEEAAAKDSARSAATRNGSGGSGAGPGGGGVKVNGRSIGPSKGEIQRAYRQLLIEAHPDHGGEADDAAQRIADLTEARRILLG